MRRAKITVVLFAVLAGLAEARTITVGPDPSYDFDTIQAAIDDANNGDEIIVAVGIYPENINFGGKNIILCSTEPTNPDVVANTVIEDITFLFGTSVVTFSGTESSACILAGFTITGGDGTGDWAKLGGGIYGNGTLATIQYNHIVENRAETHAYPSVAWGGGLYDCDGTIQYNVISGNRVWAFDYESYAAGAGLHGCDGTIRNNIISNNQAGPSACGGGFCQCHGTIRNNTIFGNSADYGAALAWCSGPIGNCIIWNNGHYGGKQIWGGEPNIIYSDIEGYYAGDSNIQANPYFADTANDDYHLKSAAGRWDPSQNDWVYDTSTSPCIDAGNPGCLLGDEPNDANNIRINMGAYGGTAEASKSPPNWAILADLTNDYTVAFNDLKVFVGYWLNAGTCIPSDLNRNEFVNFADFVTFADKWSW